MALVGAAGRLKISAKAREVRGVHRVVIRDGEAISAMLVHMGADTSVPQVGGAASAPRGARNREPPGELRRRQPAPVAPGRRRRLRQGRTRARDPRRRGARPPARTRGSCASRYRDASLDELGHHADPPMTKDAVAGRIRRLLAMADKTAETSALPGTDAQPAARLRRRLIRPESINCHVTRLDEPLGFREVSTARGFTR